jgi:lipopolysaccharide/colanic/teichoic acid biosynthesis glycosyltransferase
VVLVVLARGQFHAQARADRLGPLARAEIRADSWMRRAVDLIVSAVALAIWGPVIVALAAAVRLTSQGPAFYRQVRIGRSREPFTILKLRSMVTGADRVGPLVTSHGDSRVTRLGAVLRATKLDELPQLVNVLKGDMTLIGPRPEVPRYIPCYSSGELETLNVRPGLTGAGQIFYTQLQQAPVSGAEDPEHHYITYELPAKLGIDLEYLRRRSLGYDLTLVFRTVLLVTGLGKRVPAPAPSQDAPSQDAPSQDAPSQDAPSQDAPANVTAPRVRGRLGDDTLPLPLIRDSTTTEAAEPPKEGWFTPQRARDHDRLR